MIIYRGWGGLGLLTPLAVIGVFYGLSTMISSNPKVVGIALALGGIAGGAAGYYLGMWLNKRRPARKVDQWQQQRLAELTAAIDEGKFRAAPGVPAPASRTEGYAQAAAIVQQESQGLTQQLSNIHTLFWVPMQWIALIIGFGALSWGVTFLFTG